MMVDESRVHEKWKENANITYEQLFNPWWAYPHPGLFALIMKLDKELGREKTLQLIKECTGDGCSEGACLSMDML